MPFVALTASYGRCRLLKSGRAGVIIHKQSRPSRFWFTDTIGIILPERCLFD